MSQPVTQQPVTQQPDPYAEFGGSTTPAPTATPSPNTGSDPYAEFGGSVTPPTTGTNAPTTPLNSPDPNARFAVSGVGTISAPEQPKSFMGRYAKWLENVSDDIKYGTDHTGVGSVLKSLGAHGVYRGAPEAVGDFMASLPLGILKSQKGQAELTPQVLGGEKGHTWQGVKDLVGGGLQATQIPAAFVAPEESALSKEGLLSDAANAAGRATTEAAAAPKVAGVTHVYNAATGEVEAVPKPAAVPKPGIVKQVLQGKKVAQPGAQSAVREAVQTGVTTANDATAAREAAQSNVKIPDAYKDLVNEAMNQEPAWTPEKAQPIVKALGDDFEVKGSVGEGKSTNNDLDIWQKNGDISAAADALKKNGFKYSHDTPHGEVWTKGDQNIDLWDSAHEPKPGFGPDIPESEPAPVANKRSSAVGNNAPLVKGNTTILDDHLDTLAGNEKAAYKRMDDTAGFDVKALKDKLKTDKYNLKQLGSSDPDKTGRLVEAINDSTDRIAEANEKMKAAGIDPDEADALHQQRMAGEDFKKVLTTYTNADGSVNVKGLLRGSKQLRFSQYGDRLEQLTGSSDAADKFINQLDAMDKLGAHAIKAQKIAKMIGWGLAIPTGLKVAGSIAHDVLVP